MTHNCVIREWLWIATLLERDLQAKFNFTWRSEREHAGPYANAIRIVCQGSVPLIVPAVPSAG